MINKIKYKKYWKKSGLKQKGVGDFFLQHVFQRKPKNFLEIGVFHGVTSRNVCDLLSYIHGNDFKFTGIDLFSYNVDGRSLHNGADFVIKSIKEPSKINSIYAISCPDGGDRWEL